ncbi:MAG: rhodanese-like domain-containing protein [Chloroflexota bacterium]|nr:rhodanese-like domain-containing protein [Chloroflexota bacterium]
MTSQTVAGMVAMAKQRVQNLTVEEVAGELGANEVVLVDIREPEERTASGTIPGAVHAARGMLEFYADATSPYHRPEFETDRRIILYCASGGRSALAADTLQGLGYTRAAHLDGGFKTWMATGQPVESI